MVDDPYFLDFLFNNIVDVNFNSLWAGVYIDAVGDYSSAKLSFPDTDAATIDLIAGLAGLSNWFPRYRVTGSDMAGKLTFNSGRKISGFRVGPVQDPHIPEVLCNSGGITVVGSAHGLCCFFQAPTGAATYKMKVDLVAGGPALIIGARAFKQGEFKVGADPIGDTIGLGIWPAGLFVPAGGSGSQTFKVTAKSGTVVAA